MQKNTGGHPTGARRRRRTTVLTVAVLVAALLSVNTVLVERQEAPAEPPVVEVGGQRIHLVEDGAPDAPALVLIHGTAASGRSWDLLVPVLATHHRVIRIDLLGHGRSAKPTGAGYQIADQGRLVGEVLDRWGVGRAVVIGHSTGGSVATALTERRPDLVTALALINTGPSADAFIPQGPVTRLLSAPVLGHLLWRLRTESLVRRAGATAVTRDVEIPQAVVDDALGMTYHAFTATEQASTDYLRERPLPERLAGLGKPLLVIFGSEDRRWRSSSADDYHAVPGAVVEMLPGVGHSPLFEDPPRTADLLLAFAASHAPGS